MLKQYFNLGFKRLLNFRVYSFINISGFGIALAVCLAILLYTNHHFSFDKAIENGENSYRIISRFNDGTFRANTFACFDDILADIPQVESHATVYSIHHVDEVYVGEKRIKCNELMFANSSFLDYFSVNVLQGDEGSIDQPNTMFVTPEMADKLFPGQDAMGQMIQVKSFTRNRDSLIGFTITGIIEPLPQRSHLGYDILLSQKGHFSRTVETLKTGKYFAAGVYVKLFADIEPKLIEESINEEAALILKGAPGPPPEVFNHHLQALYDIHFSTETVSELRPTVRKNSLYILLLVGLLIFTIATINFMNIHLARVTYHRKQSNIIVFLGGSSRHLFSNAFVEMMVSISISFILSITMLAVFKQSLTKFLVIDMDIAFRSIDFWLIVAVSYLTVAFLIFLFCSSFFIKRKKAAPQTKLAIPLMVFQFAIVIALTAFTILLNKQMQFIGQKELGYSSENIMVLEIHERNSKVYTFRDEISKIPGVISASCAQHYPGYSMQDMNFSNGDNSFPFEFGQIDQNTIQTLDIQTLHYFTEAKENATDGWYINESFYNNLKQFYNEEQIAGSNFPESEEQSEDENLQNFIILGVIKDFHYTSLHSPIDNFAFFVPKPQSQSRSFRFVLARVNQVAANNVIDEIETKMHELYPGQRFSYHFLDEQLNQQYNSERILSKLINGFSVLAILVACLGLIGLSLLMIEKRTKEIAIRKVNGSTVFEIMSMFNNYFLKWIGLAFVIAIPVAWYVINEWLENFAYKTSTDWWIFGLAGLIAIVVALVTLTWQTWRAASRNPIESLRYE